MTSKKIDFINVVTKEDLLSLKEEKKQYAIKESKLHSAYIRTHFSADILYRLIVNRAKEIAFLSEKYEDEDIVVKTFLAANIVYPNNEKLIQLLLDRGITYNVLCAYSKYISNTKKLAKYAEQLEINNDISLANRKLIAIAAIFKKYYGYHDENFILTKINELVVFEKDLYKSLESKVKHNR